MVATAGTSPTSSTRPQGRSKTSPEEAWSIALRAEDAESPPQIIFETCPEETVGAPLTARPYRLQPGQKHPLEVGRPEFVVVKKETRGNEKVLQSDNSPGAGDEFSFPYEPLDPNELHNDFLAQSHPLLKMDSFVESKDTTTPADNQHHHDDNMRPTSNTPRSPLSPTMHHSSNSSRKSAASELRLPKFHPLLYESQNNSQTNSPSSSRPSSSRGPLSPTLQTRKGGLTPKNMQQMQQYHRDVLARTVSTLAGPSSQAPTSEAPRAPHLIPHGSPGPATPLMLPEPQDYIGARAIGEGSPRAVADKHIREDQERRSGMNVEGSSPAVSPRC